MTLKPNLVSLLILMELHSQSASIITGSSQISVSCVPPAQSVSYSHSEVPCTCPRAPWNSITAGPAHSWISLSSWGCCLFKVPKLPGKAGGSFLLRISESFQEKNSNFRPSSFQTQIFRLSPKEHVNNSMSQSLLIACYVPSTSRSWNCSNEHRDLVPTCITVLLLLFLCP